MNTAQDSANSIVAKRARLSMVIRGSAEVARIEIVLERKLSASMTGRLFDTGCIHMSSYTPHEVLYMELGMIGLGRMGANMTERLIHGGHRVVVHDIDPAAVARVSSLGASGAASIEALVRQLAPPRAIWIMVPAGDVVEQTLNAVAGFMQRGDIIIDGGNSNY